ncbi:MAG: hypothetical protein WBG19_09615 [Thermoplasmata archaeon]
MSEVDIKNDCPCGCGMKASQLSMKCDLCGKGIFVCECLKEKEPEDALDQFEILGDGIGI